MIEFFHPTARQIKGMREPNEDNYAEFLSYQDSGLSRLKASRKVGFKCSELDEMEKIRNYAADVQHYTRKVKVESLTSCERFSSHMTAILTFKDLKKNNSLIGKLFTTCAYDSFISSGINMSRIQLNRRAHEDRKDDIDISISPTMNKGKSVFIYLKTSLRERWKQIDRDARIAKDVFGSKIITVGVMYSEKGAKGFLYDIKNPEKISNALSEYESWAYGVDMYISLAQVERFNNLIDTILGQ